MRSIVFILFVRVAMSQPNVTREDSLNRLCNSSISAANASGIVAYDGDWRYRQDAPEHSWAVAITGGNGQGLWRTFWYDTAGKDYADDLGIKMDVCAFPNFYMPINAHRLGQHDPGNCSTVFTQRCIDSVKSMASESALKWITYSTPPPYENLTAGVLPSICNYIMQDLQETIKKDCGPQMQSGGISRVNFGMPEGEQCHSHRFCIDVAATNLFHSFDGL